MKKNTLLVIIVLASIISIIALLQLMKSNVGPTPSSGMSPIPINQDFFTTSQIESTSFSDILYTGASLFLPTTMPILDVTTSVFPNTQEKLSEFCQISTSGTSDFGTQYNLGSICNYYLDDDTFIFFNDEDSSLMFNRPNDVNHALDILNSSIISVYGNANIFIPLAPTSFVTDDAPNATQLRFAQHYNQTPIHQHDATGTDLTAIYNQGSFAQAVFPTKYLVASPQATLTTISIDQAINSISQGEAYLAENNEYNYISENSGFIDNLSSLHNIILSSATLEYRLNPEETLAIPSYHFSGTARDSQNNTMGVEIITPAINFTIAEPTPTPLAP